MFHVKFCFSGCFYLIIYQILCGCTGWTWHRSTIQRWTKSIYNCAVVYEIVSVSAWKASTVFDTNQCSLIVFKTGIVHEFDIVNQWALHFLFILVVCLCVEVVEQRCVGGCTHLLSPPLSGDYILLWGEFLLPVCTLVITGERLQACREQKWKKTGYRWAMEYRRT